MLCAISFDNEKEIERQAATKIRLTEPDKQTDEEKSDTYMREMPVAETVIQLDIWREREREREGGVEGEGRQKNADERQRDRIKKA